MSDETQHTEQGPIRELEREERRLARLRNVVELRTEWIQEPEDDFDPPRDAA